MWFASGSAEKRNAAFYLLAVARRRVKLDWLENAVTVFPLMARELRVRSRNPAAFRARVAAAALALLFCLPSLATRAPWAAMGFRGANAFHMMTVPAFLVCLITGFLAFHSVGRERADGTLPLLLLTRVTPLDVLLAAFGSIGLTSACALAAFTPIVFLPVLAGGVTGGEIVRTALVLFDTLVVALGAGLWLGSSGAPLSRVGREAVVILAVLLAPVSWLSPFYAMGLAADALFYRRSHEYWASLLSIFLCSLFLLFLAGRRLRAGQPDVRQGRLRPARPRQPLNDSDPIAWRFGRPSPAKTALWLSVAVSAAYESLWNIAVVVFHSSRWWSWEMLFFLYRVRSFAFAWLAAQWLAHGRRSGELELLLTTPLGPKTLLFGLLKSLRKLLVAPLVVMILPDLVAVGLAAFDFGNPYRVFGWILGIFAAFQAVALMVSIVLMGLWLGAAGKSQVRAAVTAVIVADGGVCLINFIYSNLFPSVISAPIPLEMYVKLSIPRILGIAFSLCLAGWSLRRLRALFPESEPSSYLLGWLSGEPATARVALFRPE